MVERINKNPIARDRLKTRPRLYRQSKQGRVADFLSNDLSEEPHRSKAVKNDFELVWASVDWLKCIAIHRTSRGLSALCHDVLPSYSCFRSFDLHFKEAFSFWTRLEN